MKDVFHEGELIVQERTGTRSIAERNARGVFDAIFPPARPFLSEQQMLALGTVSDTGQVWASLLFGERGFAGSADGRVLSIDRAKIRPVPLEAHGRNLRVGAPVGVLAIDLGSRRRLRVNGHVSSMTSALIELQVNEAFPNCPKYIQRRQLHETQDAAPVHGAASGEVLDEERRSLIARADTLFVASRHPERGADVSHRGGEPGFLRVVDERTLRVPDYPGNGFFNTLGNFTVSSAAGLAIPDFQAGRVLQLTGHASARFGAAEDPGLPTGGTGRHWDFVALHWTEVALPGTFRWAFLDASPHNPV